MKNVIVVWQCIPESIDYYILHVDEETFERMSKLNNQYSNTEDVNEEEFDWILNYLEGKQAENTKSGPLKISGEFHIITTGMIQ